MVTLRGPIYKETVGEIIRWNKILFEPALNAICITV